MYIEEQVHRNGALELREDLMRRKEFAFLFSDDGESSTGEGIYKKHQLFVANFANFNTPYSRLLIKHGTGTGKTKAGLLIAKSFLERGKRVIILGQNKDRFFAEMMTSPHLGFVTKDISDRYAEIISKQNKGVLAPKEAKRAVKLLVQDVHGIQMMGYKKFTNALLGQYYGSGQPQIDVDFLFSLAGGALIVDEVHNVYNSENRNNYGDAIVFLSQTLERGVKIIVMSGTPINNPQEIYDLCNIMYDGNLAHVTDFARHRAEVEQQLTKSAQDFVRRMFRKTLFPSRDVPITDELLHRAFAGRVSQYPQGLDTRNIPRLVIKGDQQILDEFDLKVVALAPSETEKAILEKGLLQEARSDMLTYDFAIMSGGRIVLPTKNPELIPKGLDVRVEKSRDQGAYFISGQVLADQLHVFSSKFAFLRNLLLTTEGKVIIYHNDVHGTGVITIKEMLRMNGFLTEDGVETSHTICYKCNKPNMDHRDTDHTPAPTRFALLYGEQHKDKSARVLELFNSEGNVDGSLLRIIVGSRYIRESLDFKEVRHMVLMQQPYNIPMLVQIIGRGIREGSHARLAEIHRKVKLYIPVSPLGEIEDYRAKLREYAEVQRYERVINHLAIDSALYFGTADDFAKGVKQKSVLLPSLGIPSLPFEAVLVAPTGTEDATYNAFEYFKHEVVAIDALLKQAFKQSVVWTFEELLAFVRGANYIPNPRFFSDHNVVALIKRNQYIIADGYVLPRGFVDIDSIFVDNTPRLQKFSVDSSSIMSRGIIEQRWSVIKDHLERNDRSATWTYRYFCLLASFFVEKQNKNTQIQLLRYLIQNKLYEQLMVLYGNFVVLVANDREDREDRAFAFPGAGLIHTHNALNTDIVGYVHNDQIFVYRRGSWETTALSEYGAQKLPTLKPANHAGFYTGSMKFKTIEFDPQQGVHGDKRHMKRGQICSAQNKKDKQQIYRKIREVFIAQFGAQQYETLSQVVAEFYKKKDHCATIEIATIALTVDDRATQKWFFLLDDFEILYVR